MSSTTQKSHKSTSRFSEPENLFWAAILISLGVLMLFDSIGVIEANFAVLLNLWPLIIIYFGIQLLLKNYAKAWPHILLAIATVILMFGVSTAGWLGETPEQTTQIQITSDQDIDELALLLKTSAGNVTFSTAEEPEAIIDARLDSRHMSLGSEQSYQNGNKSVELYLEGDTSWWPTRWRNDIDITIDQQYPLSLSIDAGATDLKADLRDAIVNNLHLRLGASSNDITLGEKSPNANITIDAGASSITIHIPESSAIILDASATVGSVEADSLTRRGDGVYVSDNYEDDANAVDIKATIGAGSLKIKQY